MENTYQVKYSNTGESYLVEYVEKSVPDQSSIIEIPLKEFLNNTQTAIPMFTVIDTIQNYIINEYKNTTILLIIDFKDMIIDKTILAKFVSPLSKSLYDYNNVSTIFKNF